PSISLTLYADPRDLHSFPTRRSSDLTGSQELFTSLVLLPCYQWHRRIVVPQGHPLANESKVTIEMLGKYPIVTYVFGFSGPSSLDRKSTRLNSSHVKISYAVFCLKKK